MERGPGRRPCDGLCRADDRGSVGRHLPHRKDGDGPTGSDRTGVGSSAPGEGELELDRITEKMNYIQEIVKEYYLFDEDVELVEDGIYMGLMYGLNDPYSVYYNEEDYQSLMEDTSGEYCGIGAMVSQNRTTGISTVVKVFETAPAFEAGMLPGDIIYKVDDEDVAGMELDLLVTNYIRGEEGSRVKVTVLRGDANEEVDLDIERRKVEVPTVEHEMMADNIGYIYVMQFDGVTGPQFQAAVDDLEKQGMEKLIIDLRDNPGGLLDAVVEMLAYVLPEDKMDGMLVYTADKDGKGDRFFCDDGKIRYESDYGQQASGFPKRMAMRSTCPWRCWSTAIRPALRRCLRGQSWIMRSVSWWEPRPSEKGSSRAFFPWGTARPSN